MALGIPAEGPFFFIVYQNKVGNINLSIITIEFQEKFDQNWFWARKKETRYNNSSLEMLLQHFFSNVHNILHVSQFQHIVTYVTCYALYVQAEQIT